jgi:hypothetical protein
LVKADLARRSGPKINISEIFGFRSIFDFFDSIDPEWTSAASKQAVQRQRAQHAHKLSRVQPPLPASVLARTRYKGVGE